MPKGGELCRGCRSKEPQLQWHQFRALASLSWSRLLDKTFQFLYVLIKISSFWLLGTHIFYNKKSFPSDSCLIQLHSLNWTGYWAFWIRVQLCKFSLFLFCVWEIWLWFFFFSNIFGILDILDCDSVWYSLFFLVK